MNNQWVYAGAGLVGGAAIGHYLVKKGHTYTVAIAVIGAVAGYFIYNNMNPASVTPPATT